MPTIALNDGATIPQVGFGTHLVAPSRDPTTENTAKAAQIVGQALELGYRHIDTAQMYGNERAVGDAIHASGLPRGELYITSKLGNGNHRPDDVRRSFEQTLEKLDLEWLDLFLIHWPVPTLYEGDYVSTWRAVIELLADGRLRSAGVSNFQSAHLDRIVAETGVVPAVNQIEVHPYFANYVTREASTRHRIAVEAWSPLGQGKLFADPDICRIAATHGKSGAQVILRWHIHHGHIVIPKSVHWERMKENLNVFDFELSDEEIEVIDGLDRGPGGRIGPNPDTFEWIP